MLLKFYNSSIINYVIGTCLEDQRTNTEKQSPISGNKGEADLPSTDTNCQAPPSPPTEFHGRQLPKGIKGI